MNVIIVFELDYDIKNVMGVFLTKEEAQKCISKCELTENAKWYVYKMEHHTISDSEE